MVCFSIFLPLLKGEMPEGQREFRRKALPRCAGTISRCREAFPKSSEGPRAIAKPFRGMRELFRDAAKPFRGAREPFRGVAEPFRGVRESCPLPNPAPRYPFCCFFS